MLRRAFLLTTVLASPAFASFRSVQDQSLSYSQSDWRPDLLKQAAQAASNPLIKAFLDEVDLPPPSADETAYEIKFLLQLQEGRMRDERLLTVLKLQNDNPIDAMLRMGLGNGPFEKERNALIGACSAIEPFLLAAKYRFMPARPSKVDNRLKPLFGVPGHPSYPSGHAAQGYLCGELLASFYPEKKDQCREAGISMGLGREVAGLHFPSDTVAGRHLAEQFCKQYITDAARLM